MKKCCSAYVLIVALVLIFADAVYGQVVEIRGKVIDKMDGSEIAFAHIVIENTPVIAISDLYGNYTLRYSRQDHYRRLKVSCVGYKSITASLPQADQAYVSFILEQDAVRLTEVVVKPEDPVSLLKEARERIRENHDTVPTILSGYYKASCVLGDKNVRYIEALIDVYKPPFRIYGEEEKMPRDSIRLREGRTKANEIDDWKMNVMLPWDRTMYWLEFHDVVKDFHSNRDNFDRFLASYRFEIEKMIIIDGRRTYMIRLTPKRSRRNAVWNGHIYLDEDTKAFVNLEFTSSPKLFRKLRTTLGYIILSKLYKIHYTKGEWKESIQYKREGDKWYFKEVNASKHFLISSKKRNMEDVPVKASLHFIMDSVRADAVTPDTVEFMPGGNRDEEYIRKHYHPSFWREFDRQRGVTTVDSAFLKKDNKATTARTPYVFTRLDTLQGTLSPLRSCFDVGFYGLNVEVMPEEELLRGKSHIRFRVVNTMQRMQLDLYAGMTIDSITSPYGSLPFQREFNAVYVDFPVALQSGEIQDVDVYFSGRPVDFNADIPMYASFLWAADENETPWLQAICQGYGASGWWPNKDHLSDEPDSASIAVTAPAALQVVCNGRLRATTPLNNGKVRYDWFVSYPINNYNITLNIGDYAHFSDHYVNGKDTLDLDYYVLSYHLEHARRKTAMVKPMLKTYEKFFGQYPFRRDGFKLIETPHAMEHQSCVAIGSDYFATPRSVDFEDGAPGVERGYLDFQIVLHEVAHEWWGNNISCTDNAELWIHESFATYAEALFVEDHYGYAKAQAYLGAMAKHVMNENPIIGKMNVNHIHYHIGDMYDKGALMLNTLRHVIGNDTLWFSILKGMQDVFKYKTITTDDVIGFVNEKTGVDYTYFFDQYLRFSKIPVIELAFETTAEGSYVSYRWVTDCPGFKMPVAYAQGSEKGRLYPTNEWQKRAVIDADTAKFQVNTDQFYIAVRVTDAVTKE